MGKLGCFICETRSNASFEVVCGNVVGVGHLVVRFFVVFVFFVVFGFVGATIGGRGGKCYLSLECLLHIDCVIDDNDVVGVGVVAWCGCCWGGGGDHGGCCGGCWECSRSLPNCTRRDVISELRCCHWAGVAQGDVCG